VNQMSNLTPHLWYDTQAQEAAELYCSVIPNSRITNVTTIKDTPPGDCDVVTMELAGQRFQSISAGPPFKFTPAISFILPCSTPEDVDRLWNGLSPGGNAMMPLGEYPFSRRFGWTTDRFGLSWQVMHSDRPVTQHIIPSLLFVGDVCGQAEAAIDFYTSVFPKSSKGDVQRWGAGQPPEREGTVLHARFTLSGLEFAAQDSAHGHDFGFNEAVSFMVGCQDQSEIDYYWGKLSAVPQAEQCGWIKDRFGVSWQIVPTKLNEMLQGDEGRRQRVTQAFLKMKKFDLAALEAAAR